MGWLGTRRLRDRPGEYGARQPGCGRALSTLQPLGTLLTQTDGVQKAKPFQRLMAGLGAGRPGEALMQGSPQPIVGRQVVGIVRRHAL
jgi:hypothetical protein